MRQAERAGGAETYGGSAFGGAALVLSAWSVTSPYGLGAEPFTSGLRAGRATAGRPGPGVEVLPSPTACLVPGFDAVEVLGRKGTRAMDRVTGIAVATLGLLLEGRDSAIGDKEEVGLVLGVGSGSVASTMGFTRDSLTGDKPFHVDPGRFPNTVMNCAAGQCAIWHGLKGPNATVVGGALTGLLALSYAVRLQRAGHCSAIIAGAVEEWSAERAWLDHHAGSAMPPADPLGEGCALFLLEPGGAARGRGREPLATFAAARFASATDDVPAKEALARCVTGVLDTAGMRPDDLAYVAPFGGPMHAAEDAGIAAALGESRPERLQPRRHLGDTGAASTAFQLAAVLAAADGRSGLVGRGALVTAVDREGPVGALLVRME